MKRLGLAVVAAVLAAVGCSPLMPYIANDNVIGPHGEQLIELVCATPEDCMSFARQTCGGDFDIATNNYTQTSAKAPTAQNIMMVRCKNAPGGPPAAAVAAPDGGHPP